MQGSTACQSRHRGSKDALYTASFAPSETAINTFYLFQNCPVVSMKIPLHGNIAPAGHFTRTSTVVHRAYSGCRQFHITIRAHDQEFVPEIYRTPQCLVFYLTNSFCGDKMFMISKSLYLGTLSADLLNARYDGKRIVFFEY